MPRSKPTITDELLLTRLSSLDGAIHITPEQFGLVLGGRSTGQLADDRSAGRPPPFSKIHGSIRYRLDKVREFLNSNTFNSTAESSEEMQARVAGLGHSNFSSFIQHADITSKWPFTVRKDGLPLDLFDSLGTEGEAMWLTLNDYLLTRSAWAAHKHMSNTAPNAAPSKESKTRL